jgi:hypothetical protein
MRIDYLKQTKKLGAEKVASPDLEKWFSFLILKIYHRESLHRRIKSRIRKIQELELYVNTGIIRTKSLCNHCRCGVLGRLMEPMLITKSPPNSGLS